MAQQNQPSDFSTWETVLRPAGRTATGAPIVTLTLTSDHDQRT